MTTTDADGLMRDASGAVVLHMLTTVDNPYNPFTQWDEWFAYDSEKGYSTPGFLARIANTSDEMSDADIDIQLEYAIMDIVRENVLGLYTRVAEPIDIRNGAQAA